MSSLYIGNVNGLFNEMYNPDFDGLLSEKLEVKNDILNANNYFWHMHFNKESIEELLIQLTRNSLSKNLQKPHLLAIANNTKLYMKNINAALLNLCDQGISAPEFYRYIEILNITCDLYSELKYLPYKLSIQEGFLLEQLSSKKIISNSLQYSKNPYLRFIEENIIPKIAAKNPEIIFLNGRLGMYLLTIARLVKNINPHIHISACNHSSEYFSYNKIVDFLVNNQDLFTIIDSLVLEDDDNTCRNIELSMDKNPHYSINNVKNLLYRDSSGKLIFTGYNIEYSNNLPYIQKRKYTNNKFFKIPQHKVVNIKLNPNKKCFWGKCTFCGINQKYHFKEKNDSITAEKLNYLHSLYKNETEYFWFIDEAIEKNDLLTLANSFIERNIKVYWQVRTRIDKSIVDINFVKKLSRSGLKEIRLGLESASYHVLELMNKFSEDFNLNIVEDLVKMYTEHGIAVHFPMIIGFPGESDKDRQESYEFLKYLSTNYKLFSFNINIFLLDIKSKVFDKWYMYQISKISFPCNGENYLGNYALWDSDSKVNEKYLSHERDNFMRKNLYPWMPRNSVTKPHIFYRLMETMRNTLTLFPQWTINTFIQDYDNNTKFIASENISIGFNKSKGLYLCYCWDCHHYVECNDIVVNLIKHWRKGNSINHIIYEFLKEYKQYNENDFITVIKKLIKYNFIEPIR